MKRLLLVLLFVLTACTERGVTGFEYRWSSEANWTASPYPTPAGDEEMFVRTTIPDIGAHPAVRLYQPPTLQSIDVDGTPIEIGQWSIKRLPTESAGKHLTMRYRTRYPIVNPVLEFGHEEELTVATVRDGLSGFGIGAAMVVLGFGALASLLLRASRPFFFFGLFATSVGTMVLLEIQDFFVLYPIVSIRDPVHEASIFLIATGFSGFIAEVFPGRSARFLRYIVTSSLACCAIVLLLHTTGLLHGRRLRIVSELHIAATMIIAIVAALRRRNDRNARVFLIGVVIMTLLVIPTMLTGLGLMEVYTAKWGVVFFTLCMGHVLYGQYGAKEQELEKRVHDVETLNAELRHQVAERSRDLTRLLPDKTTDLPVVGSMVAGRYRILRELGAGGMGQVFEVVRASDAALFALKVMYGQSPTDAARFAREAEIAARLSHPNLVSVVDVGIGSWGGPFIVMELVRGGALADRDLEEDEIGPILTLAAKGLLALHKGGVVHRDLKPSNVLISKRENGGVDVKLADFGIARAMAAFDSTQRTSDGVTHAGAFLGTPLYMAPEQAKGAERATPASDVFSFGVMAYELWAKKLPFETPLVFLALSNQELSTPRTFERFVPDPKLRRLLDDCLSAQPEKRPKLEALAAALAAAFDEPQSSKL